MRYSCSFIGKLSMKVYKEKWGILWRERLWDILVVTGKLSQEEIEIYNIKAEIEIF